MALTLWTDRKETPNCLPFSLFFTSVFSIYGEESKRICLEQETSLFLCVEGNMSNGVFHQGCFSWTWYTPSNCWNMWFWRRPWINLRCSLSVGDAVPISSKWWISFLWCSPFQTKIPFIQNISVELSLCMIICVFFYFLSHCGCLPFSPPCPHHLAQCPEEPATEPGYNLYSPGQNEDGLLV